MHEEGLKESEFEFSIGENVEIEVSGEKGVIIGRAEYLSSENQYYIRYKAADGRATESWWNADALKSDGTANAVAG